MTIQLEDFLDEKAVAERCAAALEVIMPQVEPLIQARADIAQQIADAESRLSGLEGRQRQLLTELDEVRTKGREAVAAGGDPVKLGGQRRKKETELADVTTGIEDLHAYLTDLREQMMSAQKVLFDKWQESQAAYYTQAQEDFDKHLQHLSQYFTNYYYGMLAAFREVMQSDTFKDYPLGHSHTQARPAFTGLKFYSERSLLGIQARFEHIANIGGPRV